MIAGGTGFLGTAAGRGLRRDGHAVVVLTRASAPRDPAVFASRPGRRTATLERGPARSTAPTPSSISPANRSQARDGRHAHKRSILDSRVQATRSLADGDRAGAQCRRRCSISGSAVGYYGRMRRRGRHRGSRAPDPISSRSVCVSWEAEAGARGERRARASSACGPDWCSSATAARCRRCCRRSASAPADRSDRAASTGRGFIATTGSRSCAGRLRHRGVVGPLNATAPDPVTNAAVRARARPRACTGRRSCPRPAFALRLLLGEMADALLLSGQRAVPAKAQRRGLHVPLRRLDDALAAIFGARIRMIVFTKTQV